MEKEMTIYHVMVLDITKGIEYSKHDYELPEAVAHANIQELYSFKTREEADEKHRELVKKINENKTAYGIRRNREIQIMTWNSRLVL
jgi:hypothetical protein